MIDFEFSIRKREQNHIHSDIELFYVIEGSAHFTVEDKQYELNRNDFLVVNVDKNHSYTAEDDFLAACMHISYSELTSMMKQSMIFFWCNTAVEVNESTAEMRQVIKKIIAEQYHDHGRNVIYLKSLYYELMNILTSDFLLNKDDTHFGEEAHKFDARKHEIAEYIRLNFDKQISLEDLSKQLFLSYAYLSKYIKRQFGMGFAEYLNNVRLNFAVSQLLHSDQSVVRIAMESGFASSAALNKAFKEKYKMTPTEYRKQWVNKSELVASTEEEERVIREQLHKHFSEKVTQSKKEKKIPEELAVISGNARHVLKKSWNRLINMGSVRDLLQSDMQQHMLFLKQELHFEYVRFWDLFDPDLYMDDSDNGYNFDKLDRVLDFLTKNDMKPYIELRNKPKRIMQNQDKTLLNRLNPVYEETPEQQTRFLRKLMIHLMNRYHTEIIESWYFELWHREPEEVFLHPEAADELMPFHQYLDMFDSVSELLREYVPQIRLGGGGFSMRYFMDDFHEMLESWKLRKNHPDFISVYSYPYTAESIVRERNQTRNADIMQENIRYIRKVMSETEFPTQELHISEWNFSVSSRNVLNDHCMKAAYLIHNMINSVDLVDMMGYWVGSDLYAAHHSSHSLLNGSGGLLSKDGIPKPAFYAFDFMNHLGKYIRKRDEHYIISDNGSGNWRIVCHNLKNLNYRYGMMLENEVRVDEQNSLFSDLRRHRIHFDLPGKKGCKYMLRIHSLNQNHGSLQDEWLAMAAPQEMWRDDLKYLERISTPRLVLESCVAENGRIVFDLVMEPNEIDYIHVTYQYS